jgi:hypothetical protein
MKNEETAALEIIDAIDRLTDAVECLHKDIGGIVLSPAPVASIRKRIVDLMSQPNVTVREKCALADQRASFARLMRRFHSRLLDVIGRDATTMPDPGQDVRPTAVEALASDQTAEALGAMLRISEWVAKVEAKYLPPDDI